MDDKSEAILDRLDPERRAFVKKVLVTSVFAVPTVASFSMDSLSVYEAHAQNGSNVTEPS